MDETACTACKGVNTMNQEQRQAYEWAKNQDYQSVAARYAKILAGLIDEMNPPNEPLTIKQLQKMVGEPVYDYLGQEWYVIQEYYDHELTMTDGTRFFDDDEIDGVDKRFYRRPPEGAGNA